MRFVRRRYEPIDGGCGNAHSSSTTLESVSDLRRSWPSAERRNGINGGDPASEAWTGEEAVYAGFSSLLLERRAVVPSRGASVLLWERVDSSI
jgi:hypothetical protein